MSASNSLNEESAVGSGPVINHPLPNVTFKTYLADRPAHGARWRAAEATFDVSITLAYPVQTVWPVFKDFNLWMNRYGFFWDRVPADNQDAYVHLGVKKAHSPQDPRTTYIVRRVIPEHSIYFDSLPLKIEGKDGAWTGHNVISLYGCGGQTEIGIFMEHTWYSERMSIEELRGVAKGALEAALAFWRDYFVPDLMSGLQSTSTTTV